MKCPKCGANYGSELVRCPYCGDVNSTAVQYANVLQGYTEDYKITEESLTDKGSSKVLKYITIIMVCVYAVILAITLFVVLGINRVVTGKSGIVDGSLTQKNNEELLEKFMEDGQYARALTLVNQTDLSLYADELTGFEYYSEYRDELETIFAYVNIYNEVLFVLDDMEKGYDYRSLTPNQLLSYHIFYTTQDSELKSELQTELEGYLKNLYRLTDEEIESLRNCDDYQKYKIEGSFDYETITKERMVNYFGK